MVQPERSASRSAVRLPDGAVIAVVVSQYHRELTEAMACSAWREMLAAGLEDDGEHWIVVPSPGAFELPVLADQILSSLDVSAVLCFGVLVKGETTHDFHIASAVAHGLQQVALEHDRPVLFGVLTCETLDQARARALPGGREGALDKGAEVARAAAQALHAMEFAEADEGDAEYWRAAKAREEARRRS